MQQYERDEVKRIFSDAKAIITGDHFVYAKKADGWYHGPDYVNKNALYPFSAYGKRLCQITAAHFTNKKVETVVGPTVGGVNLADWTSHALSRENRCQIWPVCADEEDVLEEKQQIFSFFELQNGVTFSAYGSVHIKSEPNILGQHLGPMFKVVFSQKIGTRRAIKRGYDDLYVKGKECLIVEDVINSGATVAKTRDAIVQAGGRVMGIAALCNRSGGKVTAQTLGVPELVSLLDLDMKMYKEEECPICKERGIDSVRLDLGKGKEFLARKKG